MMEQLLMKDHFTYALVIGTIILSVTAGYFLGHQDKAVVCAQYITDLEDLKVKKAQCDTDLTTCKGKGAANGVLQCKPICDQQVKVALETQKAWNCDD